MRVGPVVAIAVCGLLGLAGCDFGNGTAGLSTSPVAATPAFSVAAGIYPTVQSVTITDATPGATIYYHTNPSLPAMTYSGPIVVSNTETLDAIAVASGYADSAAAIAAYVIQTPVANAGGPYAAIEGIAVNFNGSASSGPTGLTLTYAWDFGDGTTGTGVSPAHTYTAWGTYTAKLTVTDSNNLANTATAQVIVPNGRAYANQKAIAGAHVYLMAANTTGYGGMGLAASSANASVSLLSAAKTGESDQVGAYALTGADGSFFIAGDYTCTPGSQVYLYALGGSNGAGTNTATGLLAALGACPSGGTFAATPYVVMNEVSTIATAYAFAGFATDATHVGSSGTALAETGIANSFANAGNLETLGTGLALATTPAGNGTVPQAEINTLANILADCTSTGAASSNGCSLLLGYALSGGGTGSTPTDTATAAINVAHNPGVNIATLYALPSSTPPFASALTAQPNDFTVGIAYTGIGPYGVVSISIDGSGNVWADYSSADSLIKLSPSGAALSGPNGYPAGGLNNSNYGVAIDRSGNVWAANNQGSVSEFAPSGTVISGSGGYTGGGLSYPYSLAIDGSGNVWVVNSTHLSELSSSGTAISPAAGFAGGGLNMYPGSLAIDGSGNVWVTNSYNSLAKFGPSGAPISGSGGYSGGGLSGPISVAIDGVGNVWITNTTQSATSSLVKLSSSGSVLSGANGYTGGGLNGAYGIAIDGSGSIWTTNANGNSVSGFSSSGVAMSGPSGYIRTGLIRPFAIALDGSGNLWAASQGGGIIEIVEFIGVATPVITPIAAGLPATPTADGSSKLGTRP